MSNIIQLRIKCPDCKDGFITTADRRTKATYKCLKCKGTGRVYNTGNQPTK